MVNSDLRQLTIHFRPTVLFFLLFGLSADRLYAHEYWISPVDYHIELGTKMLADIRNGQYFSGNAYPFNTDQHKSVYIADNGANISLNSRLGDYPAIHKFLEDTGLYTLVVESTGRLITYDSWEKFVAFLEFHGLEQYADKHIELGLPKESIPERYYRYAKSLVSVREKNQRLSAEFDDGTESATVLGQELEIILLDSPYSKKSEIRVQVLYKGEPLSDRQVELFHKDKEVTRTISTTDDGGVVVIDIAKSGEYLLNVVQLLRSERKDALWVSLWSSYTFQRR